MQRKSIKGILAAAAAAAIAVPLGSANAATGPSAAEACGRTCLLQVLTEFTEAITDNNISRLKLTANARSTTNGVVTPLGKGEVWGKVRRIAFRQAFVDRQPMGRLGKPEEIAAMAVYLAGDESAYTTGQAYLVDGGFAL